EPARLYDVMVATADEVGRNSDAEGMRARKDTVLAALPELQPRAKTVLELIDLAQFIYTARPIAIDTAAAAQLTPEARSNIAAFIEILQGLSDWTVEIIDTAARAFAEA